MKLAKILPAYGFYIFLGIMVANVAIVAAVFSHRSEAAVPLPVLGQLPDFNLVNQQGQEVGLTTLEGQIWVADFIFTTCAGPCPIMSRKMAALQRKFMHQPQLHLVSFSVNPEYDTPAVLAQYADRYGAQDDRWTFLTGSIEEIHRLAAEGFKMGSIETPVNHSTYFALVDGQGRLRGYYNSEDEPAINTLIDDIEGLLVSQR